MIDLKYFLHRVDDYDKFSLTKQLIEVEFKIQKYVRHPDSNREYNNEKRKKLTRSAFKSLSKLCPTKMVSAEKRLENSFCTSVRFVVTFLMSFSSTPLHLYNYKINQHDKIVW